MRSGKIHGRRSTPTTTTNLVASLNGWSTVRNSAGMRTRFFSSIVRSNSPNKIARPTSKVCPDQVDMHLPRRATTYHNPPQPSKREMWCLQQFFVDFKLGKPDCLFRPSYPPFAPDGGVDVVENLSEIPRPAL